MKIKEANVEEVFAVKNIPEFTEMASDKEALEVRYRGVPHCIFVAYEEELPVGYLIGYEVDTRTAYCWLAGVDSNYRKRGVLTGLMAAFEEWMRKSSYTLLTVKTRNNLVDMRRFLAKAGFNITKVEVMLNAKDNRIYLEKEI